MTKFCANCGTPLEDSLPFCGKCGAQQPMAQPVQQPVQPVQPSQPFPQPAQPVAQPFQQPAQPFQPIIQPTKQPSNLKKKIGYSIVAMLAMGAVVFGTIWGIKLIRGGELFGDGINVAGTRTVMIYMIGSNLESQYGSATSDIDEIIESDFNEDDTNVVIYTGGAKKWRTSEISANENAIFEIKGGELVKKTSFKQTSMTNPDNLTAFLDYVAENYHTDLYDLILWDHGGGPIVGYGVDENALVADPMSLSELSDAIENSAFKDLGKLEFIGFDACLMGSIEIGKALSDSANYLIGSEEVEPGYGWDYNFLSDVDRETKSEELGAYIIDYYYEQYEDYYYDIGVSLSMTKLSDLDALIEKVDSLFGAVNNNLNSASFSLYSQKLTRDIVYGADSGRGSTYDLVDLLDLVSGVKDLYPAEYANVEAAYQKAVVYTKSNIDNTTGLSVYFPTNNKKNVALLMDRYEDVTFSDNYYSFLKKYESLISGTKLVSRTNFFDYNIRAEQEEERVSIEIPDDVAENYQYGKYLIWRKMDDTYYMPVYQSTNIVFDGENRISMGDKGYQIVLAENSESESAGWAIAYEISRTNDYVTYTTVALLADWNEDGGWEDFNYTSELVRLYFKIKTGETVGELTDVRIIGDEEEGGAVSRGGINLNDWNTISIASSSYAIFDENGNFRADDWSQYNNGVMLGTEVTSSNDFELRLVGLDYDFSEFTKGSEWFDSNEYYCQFYVYDTQGESHAFDLVKINN